MAKMIAATTAPAAIPPIAPLDNPRLDDEGLLMSWKLVV